MNLPRHTPLAAGLIAIVLVAAIFALMAALTAHGAALSWNAVPTATGYAIIQNGRFVESTLDTTATVQTYNSMIQVAAIGVTGLWSPPSNPVYLVQCPRVLSYSLTSGTFSITALLPCGDWICQDKNCLAGFWLDAGQPFACTTGSASVSVPTDGPAEFYRLLKTQ